jgi:hypothetical protein
MCVCVCVCMCVCVCVCMCVCVCVCVYAYTRLPGLPWGERATTADILIHESVPAAVAPTRTRTEVSHGPKLLPTSVSVAPPLGGALAWKSGVRQSAYVSIRQHTSASVSIRQHTSAYVSILYQQLRQYLYFCSSQPGRAPARMPTLRCSGLQAPKSSRHLMNLWNSRSFGRLKTLNSRGCLCTCTLPATAKAVKALLRL